MNDSDEPLTPDELGYRVAEVFDLVGPLYRRALRKLEQGEPAEGASVGVRSVLDLLRLSEPMTVPQMARVLALSRQFVQRMVNDATARGWTEVTPNPAHQRSSLIRLTEEGRAAVTAIRARERALNQQVGGGLTDAELTACTKVLREMLKLFEQGDTDQE
ncbi:MarR family winged helix-turn-helix transcriptional regulator [Streptomyces sp. NPDC001260]|uniref:MarR family winged helix-turn-helix transcriptional regulator n=1 Tax=Streptomyces sp. NPDC001260 TaxID=3364551 RepID=UPI0036796B48